MSKRMRLISTHEWMIGRVREAAGTYTALKGEDMPHTFLRLFFELSKSEMESASFESLAARAHAACLEYTDDTLVADLSLSTTVYNCLRNAGIETLGELRLKTERELRAIRLLGPKGIIEIRDAIALMAPNNEKTATPKDGG